MSKIYSAEVHRVPDVWEEGEPCLFPTAELKGRVADGAVSVQSATLSVGTSCQSVRTWGYLIEQS